MSEDKTTVLEEPHDDDDEYDEEYAGPGRTIAIAAVIAIVLGVAGYFVGHASANSGPATLADAVQQAQAGKLACGDTTAAATPAAGGGDAQGGAAGGPGGAGGAQFLVRAICDRGQNGTGGGTGTRTGGAAGQGGGFAGRGFGGGFGVVGQVQSITGDTLTLTGRQGTVKVKLSSSTTVRKSTTGSLSDIKPGATVTVAGTGQNNADPATSITIVPSTQ